MRSKQTYLERLTADRVEHSIADLTDAGKALETLLTERVLSNDIDGATAHDIMHMMTGPMFTLLQLRNYLKAED